MQHPRDAVLNGVRQNNDVPTRDAPIRIVPTRIASTARETKRVESWLTPSVAHNELDNERIEWLD